jgi:hypothetical protein
MDESKLVEQYLSLAAEHKQSVLADGGRDWPEIWKRFDLMVVVARRLIPMLDKHGIATVPLEDLLLSNGGERQTWSDAAGVVKQLQEKLTGGAGGRIPAEHRTRPLGLGETARLMGYKGNRRSQTAKLRRLMEDGSLAFEKRTRQSYVFDLRDFPAASHAKALPI